MPYLFSSSYTVLIFVRAFSRLAKLNTEPVLNGKSSFNLEFFTSLLPLNIILPTIGISSRIYVKTNLSPSTDKSPSIFKKRPVPYNFFMLSLNSLISNSLPAFIRYGVILVSGIRLFPSKRTSSITAA